MAIAVVLISSIVLGTTDSVKLAQFTKYSERFVRGIASNMENSRLWKDASFESRLHLYESKERTMGNRVSVAVIKSILGRLKAMSTSTLVIVSERGRTYSVAICPETVFMHSGAKSQVNRPKVGDRVLINILEIGDDLHAVEVHSGALA